MTYFLRITSVTIDATWNPWIIVTAISCDRSNNLENQRNDDDDDNNNKLLSANA